MMSKRMPLALTLGALLFVTAGFAGTRKFHRNDRSRSSTYLSLQNGRLPDASGSLSQGTSGIRPNGASRIYGSYLILGSPGTPDNWLGGTGNWSNGADWSGGVPVMTSDVSIATGNDSVTLDIDSSINSLALGGASGSSTLTSDAHSLTIAGALTVASSGALYARNGSTVNIHGAVNNSGILATGFQGGGGNTLTITGTLTNQASGLVYLGMQESGSGDMATLGGLANSGVVDVEHGSRLQINSAVTNSGTLATDHYGYGGGNTLTINGGLTNSGSLSLSGAGDSASVQTLTNTGSVTVATGASLNLTNQPGGITDVVAGSVFSIAGSFTAGSNSAFMNLTSIEGQVTLYGQNDAITPNGGTLANSGNLYADNGSTVNIHGAVNNSGILATGFQGGGGNTLTITGTLTNQASGLVYLGMQESGSGDMATLGGLANSGVVDVEHGSRLQINSAVTNSGTLATDHYGYGGGNTLTINGGLTNSGSLSLSGAGDSASVQTLTNTGSVTVATGASLNLTNQPGGITDVVAGSVFSIAGSFTAGSNSAFMNLTSIEGQVTLYGQNDAITPNGGTLANSGNLYADNGSTVNIHGAVNNSGILATGFQGGGGNTLTITGTLTNQASGLVYLGMQESGSGDMATLGGLANSGVVDVEHGSRLQINSAVTNSGTLATDHYGYGGGNTLTINGGLTNSGSLSLSGAGDSASVQTLTNTGSVTVATGASLNLTNQPGGITDVVAGSVFSIAGSFTAGSNSAFMNLTSIEGQVTLYGQNDAITPNGGTLANSGNLYADNGSTVNIHGAVNNSGILATGFQGGGGNTLTITGTLTNQASGLVYLGMQESGSGDMATLGGLANSGVVDVEHGSRLQINSAVTNSGTLATDHYGYGGGNTLTINGGLTNSGSLSLSGAGDSASVQTLTNTGSVTVATGASLNLTNQPGGITDVVAGSVFSIAGSFTAGSNSAFMNLTSIEGQVTLYGQNDAITPNGGTLANSGNLYADNGSTVNIHGAVNNSGILATGFQGGGGNTLTITGTLTNQASGLVYLGMQESGSGDMATLGGLANSGVVDVEHGSRLQINSAVTNSGTLATDHYGYGGGNTLTINGGLTNSGSLSLSGAGDSASVQTLTNTGSVTVATGASLNLTNQPGGITDVVAGSVFSIAGSFTAGSNSAFMNLTSIEGQVTLYGQNDAITPNGGTLANSGNLYADNGSTVNIHGAVNNSGILATGFQGGGGNTLTITGTLTNQASGLVYLGMQESGSGDMATLGGLANSGVVDVEHGSRLQINSAVTNSGTLATDHYGYGGGNTLTINGGLTNSGSLSLSGAGDSASVQTLTNTGSVTVATGASLNLTNQPGGITDVVAGSVFSIAGSFTAGSNSAFMNLTSIEGQVTLYGQNDAITPNGGTLANSGNLYADNGSTVNIHGAVNNSGILATGFQGGGGNTLTITGTLTNQASGLVYLGMQESGSGDMATLGGLANSGVVDVEHGSRLQINSAVTNSGTLATDHYGYGGGNTLTINGGLTNSAGGAFSLGGASDIANVSQIANAGSISIASGASLRVSVISAAAPAGALSGFVNTGIVNIAPGGTLSDGLNYFQTAGQTTVDGTLHASGRASIVNFAGGSVYGNGTIQSPTIMSNAAINIGDSPMTVGQMSFMGNYTQEANGSLTFDIAGAATGQYDQLNVSGHATLNGVINVDLLQGFVPQVGSMFDVMNFSGLSGRFSNGPNLPINGQEHFVIEYDSTNLMLDVVGGPLSGADSGSGVWFGSSAADNDRASSIASAIAPLANLAPATIASVMAPHDGVPSTTPEPSSFLLLGSGLLCLGYSIRRRMTK